MIYTSSEVQKQFPALLKKALSEGQIRFKTRDGQVFIISPVIPARESPFEVRSIKLNITRSEILEAIRESRTRYS
ncbi:MAG: type II toxin-antitoxin system Phd/YefM family antitoxin [Chloroflexi bacterium]|nr:type II toxin-antitoxin system Phd/YefM family antitoxin [Chloroflexota bacterium]